MLNTSRAHAQELSLSINPPITVITAIPPTNATSQMNIQNNSDSQVTLQIQLKPFKAKGENGELEYPKDTLQFFKNIQILDNGTPVESIILGPKQEKSLNLNIDIPQDITASDYYFSVVFVTTSSSPTESNLSLNQLGIATNVLLSVGQKEIPKAVLEEFSTKIFTEEGPVPFTVRVKNEGSHLIQPKGEIIIKNMFGQNVGKLDLSNVNILAGSIRAISNETAESSSDFKHPIVLWKESFLLGLYSATLNISLSDQGPVFTRIIHFFAFPFQLLIIIVIIAIVAIVFTNRIKLYTNKERM
jgi:hypothetical protein